MYKPGYNCMRTDKISKKKDNVVWQCLVKSLMTVDLTYAGVRFYPMAVAYNFIS